MKAEQIIEQLNMWGRVTEVCLAGNEDGWSLEMEALGIEAEGDDIEEAVLAVHARLKERLFVD